MVMYIHLCAYYLNIIEKFIKNIIDYKQPLWYLNSVDRGNESNHLGKAGW